jgi:predicted Zn-dependent protease
MFRNAVLFFALLGLSFQVGCATPEPPRKLTISEQIEVDTKEAQNFFNDFQKRVTFVPYSQGLKYLTSMAHRLARVQAGFDVNSVEVKIHQDTQPGMSRLYSFPGTTISVPVSILKKIDYENELAALLAFELASVINRHLAKTMETTPNPIIFGVGSVFDLDRQERADSIRVATRLLYYAGYDLRGMASVFQRYPGDFSNQGLEFAKKEVEFNVREAQKARSGYLPSRSPIVRSAEFINLKKGLKRL